MHLSSRKLNRFLLILNLKVNGHATSLSAALGFENSFGNSRQNLNRFSRVGSRCSLSQNSNRDLARAILEQKMLAVIHFIVECLVVKGSNIGWLNSARSRGLVMGDLLEKAISNTVAKTHWNNSSEAFGKTNVLDSPLIS